MKPRLAAFLPPAILLGIAAASSPQLAPANAAQAPPVWFLEHLQRQMESGGRFVADNAAYRSAAEPFDAYGIEWTWGVGQASLRGRLFGLRDGVEAGDFWEMRTVWHPGEGEARALQFGGDATFAEGSLRPGEDGGVEVEQVFFGPDGSRREVRHTSVPLPEGGHVGRSFQREGEAWSPQRTYTWLPAAAADER